MPCRSSDTIFAAAQQRLTRWTLLLALVAGFALPLALPDPAEAGPYRGPRLPDRAERDIVLALDAAPDAYMLERWNIQDVTAPTVASPLVRCTADICALLAGWQRDGMVGALAIAAGLVSLPPPDPNRPPEQRTATVQSDPAANRPRINLSASALLPLIGAVVLAILMILPGPAPRDTGRRS